FSFFVHSLSSYYIGYSQMAHLKSPPRHRQPRISSFFDCLAARNPNSAMPNNDEQANAEDASQSTNDVYIRNGLMHVLPRPSRYFTPLPSPCYYIMCALLEPLVLPSNSAAGGRKIDAQMQCKFKVPRKLLENISTSATEFRKTEIRLRFFNTS
ncbi:hypothetical protein PMAYCL1PPCAC_08710, partial [Pristionchus mayeri]